MSEAEGYIEPFKIFDNVYYVGDKWVSSYLIVGKQGLVLIDTLDMPYSKWLPQNITKLGFDPTNLNYIIITHPHSDHVAGAGYLQRLFGAKVVMDENGLDLLKQQSKKHGFLTPKLEIFPKDNERLKLSGQDITFYHTPGHTQGCMSLELMVKDGKNEYRAFVVCGNGTNFNGEAQALNYLESVTRIERLINKEPKVSVNLASHPHLGQLLLRHEQQKTSTVNTFVDQSGVQYFVRLLKKRGQQKLRSVQREQK